MSKSKGNVVNPDEICRQYGADVLKIYILFMGPLEATLPWSTASLEGPRRFVERVYRLYSDPVFTSKRGEASIELTRGHHKTIKKVGEDIEALRFNTAIASLMSLVNDYYKADNIHLTFLTDFAKLLFPFAPHLAEEINSILGGKTYLSQTSFPQYDPQLVVDESVNIAIQTNGRLRGTVNTSRGVSQEEVEKLSLSIPFIAELKSQNIKKVIFVKDKILNYVINQ
jgi:leucyl-tRNA synthetase